MGSLSFKTKRKRRFPTVKKSSPVPPMQLKTYDVPHIANETHQTRRKPEKETVARPKSAPETEGKNGGEFYSRSGNGASWKNNQKPQLLFVKLSVVWALKKMGRKNPPNRRGQGRKRESRRGASYRTEKDGNYTWLPVIPEILSIPVRFPFRGGKKEGTKDHAERHPKILKKIGQQKRTKE